MKVPLSDAKANLSALVARAAAGERIIITVRGKPVAALDRVMMPMDAAMETHYSEKPTHCILTPNCLLKPGHLGPCQVAVLKSPGGLTLAELLKAGG